MSRFLQITCLVLCALFLTNPWGHIRRNIVALDTLASCAAASESGPIPQGIVGQALANDIHLAWFDPFRARCQELSEIEPVAWRVAVSLSPARSSVFQALFPNSLDLALLATQANPHDPIAWAWLGDILAAQGDVPNAIQAYTNSLIFKPQEGLNWRKLGDLYLKQDHWQAALEAYAQACYYVDRGKNGCVKAGLLHLQHQQYDLAAERFRQSLKQLPGFSTSIKGLVNALLALGQVQEAADYLPALTDLAQKGDREAQTLIQQVQEALNP